MPKPLKLYTISHLNAPRSLAEQVGANRTADVHFYVVATSKREAAEKVSSTGMKVWREDEMKIVHGPDPGYPTMAYLAQLRGVLTENPEKIYAASHWPADRSPIACWMPDHDPQTGKPVEGNGYWAVVAQVDNGTRPRFSLATLRKLDLTDVEEVRLFFDRIDVVVLD